MEQNQNRNFYLHIFKEIFLLTWLSSVFQVIFWNWKHLINCKMQGKKIFWYTILHSCLCNILCKLFLKIESKCFSETYSEIESMWSVKTNKKEIVCHMKISNYLWNILCQFLIWVETIWWHKIKWQGSMLTLLYCWRTVSMVHCPSQLPVTVQQLIAR